MTEPEDFVDKPVNITCLPTEILTNIFAMLDTRSKGRCARVCWRWRTTCYQKAVWREATFLWCSKYMDDNPTLLESLQLRKLTHLSLGCCSSITTAAFHLRLGVGRYWHCNGPYRRGDFPLLEYLKMVDCVNLNDFVLFGLGQSQNRLKHLSLTNALAVTNVGLNSLTGLKSLDELFILGTSRITRKGVNSFAGNVHLSVLRIETPLAIPGWNFADEGLYRLFLF